MGRRLTSMETGQKASDWMGAIRDAINDIDIIGGELSWRVSDLYEKNGITARQKNQLVTIARQARR